MSEYALPAAESRDLMRAELERRYRADAAMPIWRKSSRSGGGENCVEAARTDDGVMVRDSKNPAGPRLAFTRAEWKRFLASVKAGAQNV